MKDNCSLTIVAPAKLNLFLHITGRRNDGYHNLETLFQFLSLEDELYIQCRDDGVVSLTAQIEGLALHDNLIYRAAQLLFPYRGNTQLGANITLKKRIPMGGGLGGGSSDAASTLIALNQLWDLNLKQDKLAELGLQLGADVPVFIHGRATLARGVGEMFSPAQPAENWYLVVNPGVHVSTAEVFSHPDLTRDTPPLTGPIQSWQTYHNDCEPLVASLYPPVAKALNWLLEYAPTRMTGTGACVFACFEDQASAQQALTELPDEFSGFIAQGLNTSPAWQGLNASQT